MPEKKSTAEMVSEALREAGILVFVFAPLYQMFEPNKVPWRVFCEVLGSGVAFFVFGILVERRRA